MKDFLAWLFCVHLEIRMKNSGFGVKPTCLALASCSTLGYQDTRKVDGMLGFW